MSTDAELREALCELMNKWDFLRAKWFDTFGTYEGFAQWFTEWFNGQMAKATA